MDQTFQSLLLAGKYLSGDTNLPPFPPSDHTFTDQSTSHTQPHHNPYTSLYNTLNQTIENQYVTYNSSHTEPDLKRLKTEPVYFTPNRLPALQSLEPFYSPVSTVSTVSTTANPYTLESILTHLQTTANRFNPPPPPPPPPLRPPSPAPAKVSSRDLASKRRHTLTEKTRALQKLIPVEKKMDMAMVYEEAYKYIKFLQAQICALESMPVFATSASNFRSGNGNGNPRCGGLGELNRQEVLDVLVNSPAVQASLYSRGCCVYSIEQLRFLVSDY